MCLTYPSGSTDKDKPSFLVKLTAHSFSLNSKNYHENTIIIIIKKFVIKMLVVEEESVLTGKNNV